MTKKNRSSAGYFLSIKKYLYCYIFENRDIRVIERSGLFDRTWYLLRYPDVNSSGIDPISHYVKYGASERRDPSPLFSTDYYLSQFPLDQRPLQNAFAHYIAKGWGEGFDPNKYFDTKWYIRRYYNDHSYPYSPLEHYVRNWARSNIEPSESFNGGNYLKNNPDIKKSNLNPLWHFLSSGFAEGRDGWADADTVSRSLVPNPASPLVRYRINKPGKIEEGDDVLIFLSYCPTGQMSALQRRHVDRYASFGYKVVSIINLANWGYISPSEESAATIEIVRENIGFDFGGWQDALRIVGGLEFANSITFTNDSIIGPIDQKSFVGLKKRIENSEAQVIFLTSNTEVELHYQSFFFVAKKNGIQNNFIPAFLSLPFYESKEKVIYQIEIPFIRILSEYELTSEALFQLAEADNEQKNSTIHFWEQLIKAGFPFIKVQLFTAGFVSLDDERIKDLISREEYHELSDHLIQRKIPPVPTSHTPDTPYKYALPTETLITDEGVVQALNLSDSQSAPVKVPLEGDVPVWSGSKNDILAVIHGFYPELVSLILKYLVDARIEMNILITTNTEDKKGEITDILHDMGLTANVVVCRNRGRDVGPFLIEGRKYIGDAKYVLHLHTKKSPHDNRYAGWLTFLLDNLIGSPNIARSCLAMLENGDTGIVYSDHFDEVRDLRNWGYNFPSAVWLAKKVGLELSVDIPLEFPTSTMFWARVDAIHQLFDIDLEYDDFDDEHGQIDGTLAHAIERCLLYVAEHNRFSHLKVMSPQYANGRTMYSFSYKSILEGIRRKEHRLLSSRASGKDFGKQLPEVFPVGFTISDNEERRFNLVLPTLKPEKVYGGISTALRIAKAVSDSIGTTATMRILVTSDNVDQPSLQFISDFFGESVFLANPEADIDGISVVDLYQNRTRPLAIRADDLFFATAWWTADLAFRAEAEQKRLFEKAHRVIYLIQDYEPGFYAWSVQYVSAMATYQKHDRTLAIINSEELADFILAKHEIPNAFVLPYQINEKIWQHLTPTQKQKKIIIYGRPSVQRNLFPIIVEGLRRWQAMDPVKNTQFELCFAGEDFGAESIRSLKNAHVYGKLTLDNYAELLNVSAIGISLMVSPHPSYPPLEMAAAGCITIVNAFENKKYVERSRNFVVIDEITPDAICEKLSQVTDNVDLTTAYQPSTPEALKSSHPSLDLEELAFLIGEKN